MRFPVRAAVPVVAALVVALTSCGAGASRPAAAPAPVPPPAPATSAPSAEPAPPPGPPACDASLDADTGESSVHGSGAGHMSTSDAGLFIGCGSGPELKTQISPGNYLVFTAQGKQTRVRPGKPATVGPYRIEIVSLEGSAANFRITLP